MTKLRTIYDSVSQTYDFSTRAEVVFLNTGDILDGKILHHNYSAVETLPGQAKKSILNDDILYSEIRPQNKRFCTVSVENPSDFVVSTKLMVLRHKNNDFLPQFIYQYITQERIVAHLQTLAESRSGTFPQITFSELGAVEIPEYSLDEQRHIVSTTPPIRRCLGFP